MPHYSILHFKPLYFLSHFLSYYSLCRFRGIEAAILRFKWADKTSTRKPDIRKRTPIVRHCDASFLIAKEKENSKYPYFGLKNFVHGNYLPISGMELFISQKLISNEIDFANLSSSVKVPSYSSSCFDLRSVLHGINSRFKLRDYLTIRYNSSSESTVTDNSENTVVTTAQSNDHDNMNHRTSSTVDFQATKVLNKFSKMKHKNTNNPYNLNNSDNSINGGTDVHRNPSEINTSHLIIHSSPVSNVNKTERCDELLNSQLLCQLFRVVKGIDQCRTHTEAALSYALSSLSLVTEGDKM